MSLKIKGNIKIIPVILCGGSGVRLWPMSSEETPKQYLPIINKTILLHETLTRAIECAECEPYDVITVTTERLKKETIKQLSNYAPGATQHILFEPESKNTAAAIAYASLYAKNEFGKDAVLWILPADHYIEDHKSLKSLLQTAIEHKDANQIITFGIKPTEPSTEYGYIEHALEQSHDPIKKIISFKEKPDLETANEYLSSGKYYWNSGMFLGSVETFLNEFIGLCPEIIAPLHDAINKKTTSLGEAYHSMPSIPFDIAIMEKTKNAGVIECSIGWSDVGSWRSIWNIKNKDTNGNVTEGNISTYDTQDCLIQSNNLMIAAIGLKDIAIVEQGNSILIADKKNSNSMQKLTEAIKNNTLAKKNNTNQKLWGHEILISEQEGYKSSELIVHIGQKIDFHLHEHRTEFCTIISGTAEITINNTAHILSANESLFIPANIQHQITNTGQEVLKIIEVQCGQKIDPNDQIFIDNIKVKTA